MGHRRALVVTHEACLYDSEFPQKLSGDQQEVVL